MADRISSADALALLSATDANGRVDEKAFEAQRLIFANEKVGGIDAAGLVRGMMSLTSYSPNAKEDLIDAITQRLDKNQARHFGEALDAKGLRDNAFESVARDMGQTLGKGWDEVTRFRDGVEKRISDGISDKVQALDKASLDPDNSTVERVLAASGKSVVQAGQFKYGELTGVGKHAVEILGDTVDMAKMAHRFSTDENYRGLLVAMAKGYALETLKDPTKPQRDVAVAAIVGVQDWEKGLKTAASQGKQAQYLGESAGAAGLEVVLAAVPVSKLGAFGKVAKGLDAITPDNPSVLNEIIGDASRQLEQKPQTPKTPLIDTKPEKSPELDSPKQPEKTTGPLDALTDSVNADKLKYVTRLARHENVLEELIVKAKPSEVDTMLRQGTFTAQELGQMVRSEKPALGEKLFQNVSFNSALDATTKGVDVKSLTERHTGDIAEAMMTHKWVKEGYTDIHSIKNNSEWGADLVGRRPNDQQLEFMEVKGSTHDKAKSQTGDPQSKIIGWLNDATEGKKHWDQKNTQPGIQDVARQFGNEVRGGDVNATWAKVNLKRDPNTGELGYEGSIEKWLAPDERKALRKSQSKGGNGAREDGDETPDPVPAKKSTELNLKDSAGFETIMTALRSDGRWNEEQSKNIAAASLLGHASDSVQQRIDSARLNDRGTVFTVYSLDREKGPHFHSHVNGHEAAQVPAEQNLNQVVQVRQQQQEQALAQQQSQDPNTPKGPKLT